MDTKLKSDIAESAVSTELLSRGFSVLKPVGDRLPYDIAVDANGKLIRIQVKHAWYNKKDKAFIVDVRRTKTNRRRMVRKKYDNNDFDFIDSNPVLQQGPDCAYCPVYTNLRVSNGGHAT